MDTKLLKQKILDLAIRGKLVPQDPNDEPASVLLERIRAEREQLIKQGKLKRSKSTSDNQHYQNVPFEIPASWEFATLELVCSKIGSGSTPRGSNYAASGIPFFRSQNVYDDGLVYDDIKFISEDIHQQMKSTEVLPNDVLLNITGGSLGRSAVVPSDFEKGNVSQHVCILRPIIVETQYLHCFILSGHFSQTMKVTGSGREGLPKYNLEKMIMPIPPLNEQRRIVTEVNRWFSLISDLERNESELNDIIKATKTKILNLAIHGKLVPQDPNDEPASELLKRIAPHATPCDTSHYENLPHNWSIARLESLCQSITSKKYQIKQSEIKEKGKYPVISQSANYIEGYSDLTDKVYSLSSPLVIFGDHTRIVKYVDFNFIVGADGVKILQPLILPKYFYFLTEYSSTQIENRGYGRHYGYLSQYEVPIPPIEEQEKIVSKLEEIFETIDKITAEL